MDGETLKAARTALGLTQEQLAEALGVPRVTLTRWETGALEIRHGRMLDLALQRIALDPTARASLAELRALWNACQPKKRKRKGARRGR